MEEINLWVENKYSNLYKKYFKSKMGFVILNILAFTLTALMVILNIYAIKKNPFNDTKAYYVTIAILTGFIGLLTSVSSFFLLNKKSNIYKGKYQEIKKEYSLYKNKKDHYKNKNRNDVLINKIIEIEGEKNE